MSEDYMRYSKEYLADQLEAVDAENKALRDKMKQLRDISANSELSWKDKHISSYRLLHLEGKQTRSKIPDDVSTVRNAVTGETLEKGDE
jgi:hypothetical protein